MQLQGQNFSPTIIEWIQGVIDNEPGISRTRLSRRVCGFLNWHSPNGRLQEMSCRLALLTLHKRGFITLPPAAAPPPSRKQNIVPYAELIDVDEPAAIACTLRELGEIDLIAIKTGDRQHSRIWNYLMDRHHYLGAGPLCGAQIRYLIYSKSHGYVGGLAFSSAALRLQARDRWIGWDEQGRRNNLQQVICNSRFLILPQVRVPHLASHVLSLCSKRLGHDWQERYAVTPLVLETFVDPDRFRGTCYRAANWIYVGVTKGRGRQDTNNRHGVSVKDIYLYPLRADARELLCDGPPRPIVRPEAADWAEEEFGTAALGDARRSNRLLVLARDFFARPQQSIPATCEGNRAKTKAAYRFFEHKEHTMENLLAPHYEATMARISTKQVVLAVQDTTVLTYNHPETDGLGPIGTSRDNSLGLLVHDTLCFTPDGTPLGLLNVQCWARDPADFGKKYLRAKLPIEQKESYKWLRSFRAVAEAQKRCPDSLLVSVGDREADIYELFVQAIKNPRGPKLLVRAEQQRLVADDQGHLGDHLRNQPVAATVQIHIPRRGNRAARDAELNVRFAQVSLKPPEGKKHFGELTIRAVLAEEVDCPEGATPLNWMLLTTCEVASADDAVEKLRWYSRRWGIEVYHRTLKSGCKIEERQLGNADRIEACLAIDMVVAWRIFHLTKLGREVPNVPCTVYFEEAEWKALVTYKTQNPVSPEKPPTLREMTRMVASLGGFLGRKGDGEPGTKSLWIGLQRLDDITEMWKITTRFRAPDCVDPPPGAQ